ncbi:MAG: hypothetical protein FJ404_07565 [Verrucomicrobia bacterium]|nr:hypothetical protein [Verrucomicrobiota bacterium]
METLLRTRLASLMAAGSLSLAFSIEAALPELEHFFPIVVRPGSTQTVTAIGKFNPWPVEFWSQDPAIQIRALTNSGSIEVSVQPGVPNGPRLIRARSAGGASAPRMLLVEAREHWLEREPNDDGRRSQAIDTLPAALQGRLDKEGDVDVYRVRVEKGRTLIARLQGYVLGSSMDAVLRLVDEKGFQLAINHDDGKTLDPFLSWTASRSETVFVQVFGFKYPADSSVRFSGDSKSVYRLEITDGVWVEHLLPLGVNASAAADVVAVGWNFSPGGAKIKVDPSMWLSCRDGHANLDLPLAMNTLTVPVGRGPEWMETTLPREAPRAPFAITGELTQPGEQDRWPLRAGKGERLLLRAQSARFGFPLDPWLKVFDAAGKQLAHTDDADSLDAQLDWVVPEDGEYAIVVGGLLQRGGSECRYRLSVEPVEPGLKLSVAEHQVVVEVGKTNSLRVTASRLYGFTNKVELRWEGGREGLQVAPVAVPENGGEMELKFVPELTASLRSEAIRLEAVELDGGRRFPVRYWMTTTGINNGVPNGYHTMLVESTDQLWLAVTRPPTNAVAAKP